MHDSQTLFPGRQVRLGRSAMRHRKVINEEAIVFLVLVGDSVAVLQACIEEVVVLTAPVMPRCSQILFLPETGCSCTAG